MNTDFHILIKLSSIQEDPCQFTHISLKIYRTEAEAKAKVLEAAPLMKWFDKRRMNTGSCFFSN